MPAHVFFAALTCRGRGCGIERAGLGLDVTPADVFGAHRSFFSVRSSAQRNVHPPVEIARVYQRCQLPVLSPATRKIAYLVGSKQRASSPGWRRLRAVGAPSYRDIGRHGLGR